MVKILHAIGNLNMGGAEFQCRQLVNNLPDSLYRSAVAFLHFGSPCDIDEKVALYQVQRNFHLNVCQIWKQIEIIFDEFKPDVVQVWIPEIISVPVALCAWRRGIPIVCAHRKTFRYAGALNMYFRDRLRCPQYLCSTTVVANFCVDEEPAPFRWLFRRKGGRVIYNGLDVVGLRALPHKKLPVRSEYRLIFAGRLAPQKGIPIAIRALDILKKRGVDVHLTLFGTGPGHYVTELEELVNQLELQSDVTFFGECGDWQAYASDSHSLVFPTRGEGTSNVILEALAVGIPVVISDVAMTRDLLVDDETAIVVRSDIVDEWANELHRVIADNALREAIGRAGRALAERFSVGEMVKQYQRVYDDLLLPSS